MSDVEVVYVIGSRRSALVKIGTSTTPDRRLAELQCGSPVPLAILWHVEGGATLESLLHRHFKHLRRHGEWFDFRGLDPVAEVSAAVVAVRSERTVEELPESDSALLARNRKWRRWLGMPTRMIRISDGEWADYKAVCDAEKTDRAKDVRAFVQRRIRAYRRKHPDVALPSDAVITFGESAED